MGTMVVKRRLKNETRPELWYQAAHEPGMSRIRILVPGQTSQWAVAGDFCEMEKSIFYYHWKNCCWDFSSSLTSMTMADKRYHADLYDSNCDWRPMEFVGFL